MIEVVTLSEAGRRLKLDPKYVKGAAEAIEVKLAEAGTSFVMSETDFDRLKSHLSSLTARRFRVSRAG